MPITDLSAAHQSVSTGNPCPFLRGIIESGFMPNGEVPIDQVVDAIKKVESAKDPGSVDLPSGALKFVAATANGFLPTQVKHNLKQGVDLNKLRAGPFYKHSAHSRILNPTSDFIAAEFDRLVRYASMKLDADGNSELGLNHAELEKMLHDNYERAKGERRLIDRSIMESEFPVLLTVIGKQGKAERYLAVEDVRNLFQHSQLPARMLSRLGVDNSQGTTVEIITAN